MSYHMESENHMKHTPPSVAAPLFPAVAEKASLQDRLKSFGQRVTLLQKEFVTGGSRPSEAYQRSLWWLLLEMRPFLFLCTPTESSCLPADLEVYRTCDTQRNLRHVRLAVRLYLAILRLATPLATATLHGCLTLLSLLPLLADPDPAAQSHTWRYLEGLRFTFFALHRHDLPCLQQLVAALLPQPGQHRGDGGLRNFLPGATQASLSVSYGSCCIGVLPAPAALEELFALLQPDLLTRSIPCLRCCGSGSPRAAWQLRELFHTQVCATTHYGVCATAFGCCNLMSALLAWDRSIALGEAQVSLLVCLSCGLLSAEDCDARGGAGEEAPEVGGDAGGAGRQSKMPRLESVGSGEFSSACCNARGLASWSQVLHHEAGKTLLMLLEAHMLQHEVHGPLLLHTLSESWLDCAMAHAAGMNGARGDDPPWWSLRLLRWVSVEASPGAWQRLVFLQCDVLERIVAAALHLLEQALSYPPPPPPSGGDRAAGNVPAAQEQLMVLAALYLVSFLQDSSRMVDEETRRQAFARCADVVQFAVHVDRLLSLRPPFFLWRGSPPATWPRGALFLAHHFVALFPASLLMPLLEGARRRAVNCLSVNAYRVVEANYLGCAHRLQAVQKEEEGLSPADGAAALVTALGETRHAVVHHPKPDLPLLAGSLIVLLELLGESRGGAREGEEAAAVLNTLIALEEHLAAYRVALLQVPDDAWWVLSRALAEQLPIPRQAADSAVCTALRRMAAVPRKMEGGLEHDAHGFRLAGTMTGLATRLSRFFLAQRERVPCSTCGASSLAFLRRECELVLGSARAMVDIYVASTADAWTARRVDSAAVLLTAIYHLQLSLLTSAQPELEPPSRSVGPPRDDVAAFGVVVDVDEDDGDEEGKGGGMISAAEPHFNLHARLLPQLVALHDKIASTALPSESESASASGCLERSSLCGYWSYAQLQLSLLKCICTSIALSPCVTAADRCFCDVIASHPDVGLRCGYAALALDAMMRARLSFSFLKCCVADKGCADAAEPRRGWLEWEGRETATTMTHRLEFLQAVFTQRWAFVWAHVATAEAVAHPPHLTTIRRRGAESSLVAEGQRVLEACEHLWEGAQVPLEVKSAALETAHQLLEALCWSPEDLCRASPDVIGTSFFAALCDMADTEAGVVALHALDVLLLPLLLRAPPAAGESAPLLAHLKSLLQDRPLPQKGFAPMLARVLYGGAAVSEQLDWLRCMIDRGGVRLESIPELTNDLLASVVLYLVSLEGDAQLAHALEQQSATDAGSYPSFCLAVQQAVSLCDVAAPASLQELEVPLQSPTTAPLASRVLVRSIFDIVDSISGRMGMDYRRRTSLAGSAAAAAASPMLLPFSHTPTVSQLNPSVSRTTLRRWLFGLGSFIRFMGQHATMVAAKLPSMLAYCCQVPALAEDACHVWRILINSCTDEYLREHAPTMVVDLLSLGLVDGGMNPAVAPLVQETLQELYQKTAQEAFWRSVAEVMGLTNPLMRLVCEALGHRFRTEDLSDYPHQQQQQLPAARSPQRAPRTAKKRHRKASPSKQPPSPSDLAPTGEHSVEAKEVPVATVQIHVVLQDFIAVMQCSSAKCRAVFVRALHQYLHCAGLATRPALGRVTTQEAEAIPLLLQCAYDLNPGDVPYALSCVGMIGAVAPLRLESLRASSVQREAAPRRADSDAVAMTAFVSIQRFHLRVEMVLCWKLWCRELLNVYCPRALGNTADPVMHDRAAYAVQELLRVCVKKERAETSGMTLQEEELLHVGELQRYTWWTGLSAQSQQMLEGFTTTRYATLIVHQMEQRTLEYHPGMSFGGWVFAFFCNMASRCRGWLFEAMAALRNVAKRDGILLTFLVPYVVVHLLEHGDPAAVDGVVRELEAVFDAARGASGPESGSECPGGDEHYCMSLRSENHMENAATPHLLSAATLPSPMHAVQEHVQYALHLLEDIDHLRWDMLCAAHRVVRPDVLEGDGALAETCTQCSEAYKRFLSRIAWPKRLRAAMEAGSYLRALRSLESQRYLPNVADVMREVPLQRMFAALEDRDSARSIHRRSHGLTPAEMAFALENNGDWLLALQQCELVLQHDPQSIAHQFTSLRCMRHLGQLHMMSRYSEALLVQTKAHPRTTSSGGVAAARHLQHLAALQNYANEAAWRLGEWEKVHPDPSLPVSLAVPVVELMRAFDGTGSPSSAKAAAMEQRAGLAAAIRATCHEGYGRAYPYVATLHAFADVELVADFLLKHLEPFSAPGAHALAADKAAFPRAAVEHVVEALKTRMSYLDTTLEVREPMLSLHRAIYRALGLKQEVAQTWIEHAQLLKNAGFLDAALNAARQSDFGKPGANLAEYYGLTAELLHAMKDATRAIEFAQEHAANARLPSPVRARLQIQLTNWKLEVGSQTPKEVMDSYKAALALDGSSEAAHHHLALFYDKLYTMPCPPRDLLAPKKQPNLSSASAPSATAKTVLLEQTHLDRLQAAESYALSAVIHFGQALLCGLETISVSLPRMLTLWLDTAALLFEMSSVETPHTSVAQADRLLKRLNALIESYLLQPKGAAAAIVPKVVMTALPQLLSRLGHPSAHVVSIITRTVTHLMSHFPQQCLWLVLPIALSKQAARMQTVRQGIINPFTQHCEAHQKHLKNAFDIFSSLIELCNCPPSAFASGAKLTQQPFIKRIEGMLSGAKFILPTMHNMTPNLAAADAQGVFPGCPTFHHFDDRVQIMASLQKPKRIWIHTGEGGVISFLCKSKDEPRKDIRMMEIASLMNTFFLKDPDARRKNFSLRRYAIAALTDDCAMIEWVNHLDPLRNVVNQCYLLDGTGVRVSQVKAWYAKVQNAAISKMDMFTQHILPAAPPVLHQWFGMTFPNNQEWYQARDTFTRSIALWSIAGHIAGLGDRHGENLMLDLHRGEMLHVDFACMFDKGETLEVPERVRFRLTQNLIDGMGVLGADGPFRANCEVALRCQIKNKNAVMSIVETLLYDPLVEWSGRSSRSQAVDPKRLIDRVARRLDGFLDFYATPREEDTLALNVEGQVSKLISHSSALENLCEMYIWWMAWI